MSFFPAGDLANSSESSALVMRTSYFFEICLLFELQAECQRASQMGANNRTVDPTAVLPEGKNTGRKPHRMTTASLMRVISGRKTHRVKIVLVALGERGLNGNTCARGIAHKRLLHVGLAEAWRRGLWSRSCEQGRKSFSSAFPGSVLVTTTQISACACHSAPRLQGRLPPLPFSPFAASVAGFDGGSSSCAVGSPPMFPAASDELLPGPEHRVPCAA